MNFALLTVTCALLRSERISDLNSVSIGGSKNCEAHPAGSSDWEVCGPDIKVTVYLMSGCNEYKKYTESMGCAKSGCVKGNLESGYTEKFNWNAYSYKIESCH